MIAADLDMIQKKRIFFGRLRLCDEAGKLDGGSPTWSKA
jgi:hypothetical protein